MTRRRSWTLFVLLYLATAACHSSKSADAGVMDRDAPSETNDDVSVRGQGGLFSVCLDATDCLPGLVCACGGVCTISCNDDVSVCGRLDAGASCPIVVPETTACDSVGAGCVVPCTNDDACASFGPAASCRDGWCKIAQASTLVDGGAPSCDGALATLKARVDQAVAAADLSCVSDSDCASITAGNRCYGSGCPLLTHVNARAAVSINALLISLDTEYCDALLRAGCVTAPGPHSCGASPPPACVNGSCAPPARDAAAD